jgi:hypothetical protein
VRGNVLVSAGPLSTAGGLGTLEPLSPSRRLGASERESRIDPDEESYIGPAQRGETNSSTLVQRDVEQ